MAKKKYYGFTKGDIRDVVITGLASGITAFLLTLQTAFENVELTGTQGVVIPILAMVVTALIDYLDGK